MRMPDMFEGMPSVFEHHNMRMPEMHFGGMFKEMNEHFKMMD